MGSARQPVVCPASRDLRYQPADSQAPGFVMLPRLAVTSINLSYVVVIAHPRRNMNGPHKQKSSTSYEDLGKTGQGQALPQRPSLSAFRNHRQQAGRCIKAFVKI